MHKNMCASVTLSNYAQMNCWAIWVLKILQHNINILGVCKNSVWCKYATTINKTILRFVHSLLHRCCGKLQWSYFRNCTYYHTALCWAAVVLVTQLCCSRQWTQFYYITVDINSKSLYCDNRSGSKSSYAVTKSKVYHAVSDHLNV